jgi:hypothetical protein
MSSPKKSSKSYEGTCSPSKFPYRVADVCRDYGDLMEEAATAPGAAETNGVADHEDTEMSLPETNGIALSEQAQTPQQVRGHAKRLEYRTLSNCNQEPQQPEMHSPSAEAEPTPDAARAFEGSMPQAILGTGMYMTFDNRCFRPGKL